MTERINPIGEDDLHAYVDGRLRPERLAAVEALLRTSPEIAAQVAAWRAQRDQLREQLAAKEAEPIPARLRVANIQARRRQSFGQRSRMVAAAVVLLLTGAAGGWIANGQRTPAGPTQTAMVGEAISAYRTFVVDVAHPVEVKAVDQGHLLQWLSNRLGQTVKAPDLSAFGFQLMGGRLLPASVKGVAAQLMYDDAQGTRLTLYLRTGESGETAFSFVRDGNVSAFYWIDQGLGFAVSAAASRERLLPIVEAVYHQDDRNR